MTPELDLNTRVLEKLNGNRSVQGVIEVPGRIVYSALIQMLQIGSKERLYITLRDRKQDIHGWRIDGDEVEVFPSLDEGEIPFTLEEALSYFKDISGAWMQRF